MKNIILFCFLIILSFGNPCKAQDGDFFLTHFSPGEGNVDNVNFNIIQDHRGVLYIANRAGILAFDGKNWGFTKMPSSIFSLSIDKKTNTLYGGGRNGFGRLNRDRGDNLVYQVLSDKENEANDIFSTLIHDDKLFAINQNHIFIYDISNKTTEKITPKYSGKISSLVLFKNEVYVSTTNSGLRLIESNKLIDPRHDAIKGLAPMFITEGPRDGRCLIGSDEGKLYLFNNDKLLPLDFGNDQNYIRESDVQNGIWFNDTLAALSTLKGGVIFINPVKQKVEQIINYQTGLPDNEILALAVDKNKGVWAAHAEGLTRISPTFPFRNFNRYPGLEGKLLSVKNHKGILYVGTSLGAYYLEEVRDYNETVTYVKVPQTIQDGKGEVTEEGETIQKKKGGGILGFLKRGKNTSDQEAIKADAGKKNITPVYKATIEKELQSIKYSYRKIKGIESKILNFSSKSGRLFCGGMDGLFEIKGSEAKAISRQPMRYFYISESQGKIFASTYNDELKVFNYKTSDFEEVNIFGDYKDYVQHIFEDNQNRIWFCSINDLYWVKLKGNEVEAMDEYVIDNPYYYETYGMWRNDSIILINESGIYTVDELKKKLTLLKRTKNDVDRYLPGSDGSIWMHYSQNGSALMGKDDANKLSLLSLFKDINYISTDLKWKDYWVITDNNDLYRLSASTSDSIHEDYPLFLKGIRTKTENIALASGLKFDQQNSNLIFEFVQPDYSGVLDIQYQYKLDGLNNSWSEWSSGYNVLNFTYLPEGEYTLYLKSKDALGKYNEATPVTFEIIPPYWKMPWFYAFEFTVLAMLLFLAMKLKKLGYKYRLVSRLLALLTLVIILEFIQTVAEDKFEATSPVIEFLIQVMMAIIVLPLEGVLRKYFLTDKKVKVLDLLKIKHKQINTKINE